MKITWQTLYRGGFYRGGPILMSAIAGIDQALWDIKGKRYGLPVYQMLGSAVRDKVQIYIWIGGRTPAEAAESARQRVGAGYKAIKMDEDAPNLPYVDTFAHVEAVIARVGAVREAIGAEIGLGMDFHGPLHKSMAKVVAHEYNDWLPVLNPLASVCSTDFTDGSRNLWSKRLQVVFLSLPNVLSSWRKQRCPIQFVSVSLAAAA